MRRTHAHHLQPWGQGGRTDRSNLVSLCGFHHRRLHEGAYTIGHQRDGSLSFEARSGRLIKGQSQRRDAPVRVRRTCVGCIKVGV
ncbi:MAG: HNH endonuclease signature motif containing protein [Candidatus Dormibacter sp.]|uniref:HNH endonuclease signature motif containing protein n=1 Tax=Candidatus Dormibacter sp. TaxID=2973982 RepID=UPI003D9B0657